MKQSFFRTFFSFSKNQQRGIIALLFILIVSSGFLWIYDPVSEEIYDENIKKQVAEFLAAKEEEEANSIERPKKFQSKSSMEFNLRDFDPNTESLEGFILMGFTEKLANNFINYRNKVKSFSSPKDISALYSIDDELYAKLEPFIKIQRTLKLERSFTKPAYNKGFAKEDFTKSILNVDLNRADTTELMKIKGIGSYYARGIIKFRNALGGFSSEDQIREAYVFQKRAEAADLLLENVFIDSMTIIKISVNEATFDQFWSHPYLNKKVSNALYNYREQHGPFKNVEDIKKCHLVTDEIYLKIAPYLSIQ